MRCMYCRNCGYKLEEDDFFCPECGRRVKVKKEPLIDFKNLEKKYRKQFIGLSVLLIIVLVYHFLNSTFFSEEAVIRRYVKAYANKDYMTVIELSGKEKNQFITKQNIQRKYGSSKLGMVDIKILTTNNSRGEHTRTVKYTTDNANSIISLRVKSAGRRFLIFHNYVITSSDLVAENIKITVPKDSKLVIDGVELSDKDKISTKEAMVTYKIDSILKKDVKISLKLNNRMTITDVKSVFTNEEIDYQKLNYSELDSKSDEKIVYHIKEGIQSIVEGAIKGSDFQQVRESSLYSQSLKEDTLFEESYHSLIEKYKSKAVSDFVIGKITINHIKLGENENAVLNVTVHYQYKDRNDKIRETSRRLNLTFDHDLFIHEFYLSNLFSFF